jgi:hypothetical protein
MYVERTFGANIMSENCALNFALRSCRATWQWHWWFFFLFLLLSALGAPCSSAQTRHWNFGQRDRASECLGQILKRKILVYQVMSDVNPSVCEGGTAEAAIEWLKGHDLGLAIGQEWALVGHQLPRELKDVVVTVRVTAPSLTQDQQDHLCSALVEQSRFIPVGYGIIKHPDGWLTADILLCYRVEPLPGDKSGALRMVALLRQQDQYNRLSFVEMQGSEFQVKWDSGELDAENVGIEFDDVDGAGNMEIVATGERPNDIGEPKNDVLAVFDLEGNELTRQEKCLLYGYAPKRADEMVCPIEGADVSFMTGTIPWKIKVEDSDTSGRAKSTIYKLVKDERRYVRVIPPNAISQKKSSEP